LPDQSKYGCYGPVIIIIIFFYYYYWQKCIGLSNCNKWWRWRLPFRACRCDGRQIPERSSNMRRELATMRAVWTSAYMNHTRGTWYASSWRHAHLFHIQTRKRSYRSLFTDFTSRDSVIGHGTSTPDKGRLRSFKVIESPYMRRPISLPL